MDLMTVTDSYVHEITARRWGIKVEPFGKEWHGPCPFCGGQDRFIIFPNGYYWCRPVGLHCGKAGWLDEQEKIAVSPDLLKQRQTYQQQMLGVKRQEAERWLEGFRKSQIWLTWYKQVRREWWHAQGIQDSAIDFYELGFIQDHPIKGKEGIIKVPAYSIPVRDLKTWEIVNVQFRLEQAPEIGGKYRMLPNLPQSLFFTEAGVSSGELYVVEGAKKAIVLSKFLGGESQVVGLPGCTPRIDLLNALRPFEPLWLLLDPGAEPATKRFKEVLPQTKIISLPGKPDDLILIGLSRLELEMYKKQPR